MIIQDRRSLLRSATKATHSRVDDIIAQAGFFNDSDSYASYLAATWRARVVIEGALDAYGAQTIFSWWPQRRLLTAIAADIADLRGPDPTPELGYRSPVRITTSAQALGALYVLEGSALGARILIRRAAVLGMTALFGARHMAAQVAMPTAWPEFLRMLEATYIDSNDEDGCSAAALATFELFALSYETACAHLAM